MATIVERKLKNGKKKYQVKIKVKGHPCISKTFDLKTEAKEWVYQEELKLKKTVNMSYTIIRKTTVGDLIDKYLNIELEKIENKILKSKELSQTELLRFNTENLPKLKVRRYYLNNQLSWWKKQIGNITIDKCFDRALLTQCLKKLMQEPFDYKRDENGLKTIPIYRSASTANKYRTTLSSVFNYAKDELCWIDSNPIQLVKKEKEPKGRVRALSKDELKIFLKECKKSRSRYLYIFVLIALCSGCRFSEIQHIKYQDIDLNNRRILIENTKNGESKSIYITNELFDALSYFLKVQYHNAIYIFANEKDGRPEHIRKAFATAIKKAGIKDFRFHDLRHTTASYLAMNGATLLEIAEVLGHKTLEMVKRYSHLTQSHTNNVIGKMTQSRLKGLI